MKPETAVSYLEWVRLYFIRYDRMPDIRETTEVINSLVTPEDERKEYVCAYCARVFQDSPQGGDNDK